MNILKVTPKISYYCFRKWTRKKFAILRSLSMVIRIGVICASYSLINGLSLVTAQPDSVHTKLRMLEIDEVQVTGKRSQAAFSDISRTVTVISKDDIDKVGHGSINDIIEFVSNADIRQRGNFGIQADISIRGGSFDHTMVLLNGINFTDPQTGHLSLDLPIDIENIDKIEVLEGSGARVLGSGAFTGAVNIITRQPLHTEITASQTIGEYGYKRTQVFGGFKKDNIGSLLSCSYSLSDGYMRNTDFQLTNLYYRGNLVIDETLLDVQFGWQSKDFGAGGFYSPRFPDQYEQADVWLASLKIVTGLKVRVIPSVYWRRRKDHYLLDREDPQFYENFHMTDIYGSQLNVSVNHGNISNSLGYDLRAENILSNNIGYEMNVPVAVRNTDSAYYTKRYNRTNLALFQESSISKGRLQLSAGLMIFYSTDYADQVSVFPGMDLSYRLTKKLTTLASINRSQYLPTFTDLFYKDPVNEGSIDLSPNLITSFESGIKFTDRLVIFNISGFYNKGKNIIDWLWSYTNNNYGAANLNDYQSLGISSTMDINLYEQHLLSMFLGRLKVNYMFLDVRKSVSDDVSKYSNLKHKLSLIIIQRYTKKLSASWDISYQDRSGEMIGYNESQMSYFTSKYDPFWLINGSLHWSSEYIEVYTEMTNLLNTRYIDTGSVIQPGRWLKAGLKLKLKVKENLP